MHCTCKGVRSAEYLILASRRPDGSLRASWKFSGPDPRPKAMEDAAEELEFEHGDKGLNEFLEHTYLFSLNTL